MKNKAGIGYIEHEGKAVVTDGRFEHVMAIALDPRTKYTEGIIRCITAREGDVTVKGYVDRSVLHKVTGDSLEHFTIHERIAIQDEETIIGELKESVGGNEADFIGLEDPDIWVDPLTDLIHVYFTIPIKPVPDESGKGKIRIHLGHAFGTDFDSLKMTAPVLTHDTSDGFSAKELSIAPINSKGFRYNLVESRDRKTGTTYSTVQIAIAEDMGKPWKYGECAFHPAEHSIPWISGHASPGPLLPKSFIDLGGTKLVGIMNGREANTKVGGETKYGMFSVGLFIYDYENGKIEWVSPQPLIQDSEAVTITFASQFIETGPGKGILYAHVDDSFVRAYTLDAEGIKALLPK
jgi:hypothetical protein